MPIFCFLAPATPPTDLAQGRVTDLTEETGVMNVKQVIAVRDDLGMNRGKIAAQAAHASMLFLLDGLRDRRSWTAAESLWLSGHVELSRRNANLVQTL